MGNWAKGKIDRNERLGSGRSPLTQMLQYKLFSKIENQHSERDRGKKPEEVCVKLLKELCNWLEEEMEDNLLALDQLHGKLVSFEKPPDKALAYTWMVT